MLEDEAKCDVNQQSKYKPKSSGFKVCAGTFASLNMILSTSRDSYKQKFRSLLNEYVSSKLFQTFLEKNELQDLTFCQLSDSHIDDTMELLCEQMSKRGKPPESIVFDITKDDLVDYYKLQLKHFLKTGLYVIVLNKQNKVIASNGIIDICDKPYIYNKENNTIISNCNQSNNIIQISSNFAKRFELAEIIENKVNKVTKKTDISIMANQFKFGESVFSTSAATDNKYKNKGIHFLLLMIMFHFIYKMNYKQWQGYASIKSQRNRVIRSNKSFGTTIISIDYSNNNFQFNDGTKMEYFYNRLKTVYNYSDQQIELLKKELIVMCSLLDLEKLKKLNVIRDWEMINTFAFQRYYHNISKKQTKTLHSKM